MKKFYIETYDKKAKKWKRGIWAYKTLEKAAKAIKDPKNSRVIFK